MNKILSTIKIPQRQERKIGEFIIRQNLVLPRDFRLTDLPTLSEEVEQKLVPPIPNQSSVDATRDLRPLGTARDLRPFDEAQGLRPAAPKPFKIEFEEPKLGKGLRMGQLGIPNNKLQISNKPIEQKPKSGIMNNESPVPFGTGQAGIMDKKKQDIDRKLEELKKKALKGKL